MKSQYEELIKDPEFRKQLAIETLVLEATETVSKLMQAQGVTKADLARRLGRSRAFVTQLLNGSANMTLKTLAEVMNALGSEISIGAKPIETSTSAGRASVYRVSGQSLDSSTSRAEFRMAGDPISKIDQSDAIDTDGVDQRPGYAA